MGGSGSKVTPFTTDAVGSVQRSNTSCNCLKENGRLEERIKELERELYARDEAIQIAEDKRLSSEKQIASLHSQVSGLQESLAVEENKNNTHRSSSALEHMVSKLEGELETVREELVLTHEKYERRLQRVRSSSAKSQAESALSLFELRDENQRLTQENTKLLDQVRDSGSSASEKHRQDSCGHMQLIIDLSQQLSTQEGELREAKETLIKHGLTMGQKIES